MRYSSLLPWALLVFAVSVAEAQAQKELRVVKGDYEVVLTANGLEAKYRGTPIICANHLTIHRPGWKGVHYASHNLPGKKTARVTVSGDRIVATDAAPELEATFTQECEVSEKGITITLKTHIGKEIPASPTEFPLAIFPAEVFAGGRYRVMGLLGGQEWDPLPAEKPQETGPGTKVIATNLFGIDLEGKGVALSVESLEGPPPSFFDMRSREYSPAEKNYWLLYSWTSARGDMRVQARITARQPAPAPPQVRGGKVFILEGAKGHEVRGIAVNARAHDVEKAAAKELQAYLCKMSGAEIPLIEVGAKRPFDRGVIYVGQCQAALDEGLFGFLRPKLLRQKEMDALGYDGFVIRSVAGNLVVAGKNHRGTAYGVYRLLEKLGCRFYARELEVVPTLQTLEIPGPFTETDSAAFEWRAMTGTIAPMKCRLSPGDAEARVGDTVVPRMMGMPPGGWFWHHTMGFLLPGKDLIGAHPEYLALINGKREAVEAAVQQYCLSNPDVLRAMTDAVLDWVDKDPDRLYYPVHYGDVVKFCECEKCKAFYEEKGSISDAVIWFDNQIARAVSEKFPGKFVTILAYHSTRKAPVKVRPEPNLLIIFCAIVECQGRPWTAPINMKKDVCKDLEDWARIHPLGAKGIISFDYPTTYHFAGFPYPALYAYVENIRYYKKVGLRGTYVCGLGGWKHLEHLYSYVMPRIMWNPDQDLGALIDEFCKAWYGPAWEPMREYVEMLHRGAMESQCEGVMDCHAGPGQKFFRELYTREFLDKAEALFKQAESLAQDPFVKRRIQKEKWGVLFVDLFLHGQKGGDLVPAPTDEGIVRKTATLDDYKKMAEFLQITRLFNRPWNMEPRRKFTLSSLIGIEPTTEPWWTCPVIKQLMDNPEAAYQSLSQLDPAKSRNFVTLESQHLKAVVIPRLGGRIWRLYDKRARQDVFWRGTIPLGVLAKGLSADSYVNLGGYEEYAGEKFGSPGWAEAYECKPSADGKSLTLTARLAGGLVLTRNVSLMADGMSLEVDSTLTNTSGQVVKGAMLRAHPQFNFKPGQTPIEFTREGEKGSEKISAVSGENFLRGTQLPGGRWAARLPQVGLTIVNEFDPAQVSACLLYLGPEFFNLELFSKQKDLAPGEKIQLRTRYLLNREK